jgi:hypothetical protein
MTFSKGDVITWRTASLGKECFEVIDSCIDQHGEEIVQFRPLVINAAHSEFFKKVDSKPQAE